MKQLIENRYIGAKVGDNIGVVDRRGFIAPDEGGKSTGIVVSKIVVVKTTAPTIYLEVNNAN